MGAIVGALRNTPHDTGLDMESINAVNGAAPACCVRYGPKWQTHIIAHMRLP